MLGDEVRTYEPRALRAAALVYAHFKKEFRLADQAVNERVLGYEGAHAALD